MWWMDSLTRQAAVWRAAWQAEGQRPTGVVPSGRAAEFLPAVLEIQEGSPSPIGRSILWTVMAFFMAAVLWASLGSLDIVAIAPGKIIPSGHSKVIQPYEAGVVTAIHVQDGQVVRQGALLIELDPTMNRADHDRAVNERQAASVEAARLRALIDGRASFEAPEDSDPQFVAIQGQLLRDQLAEHRARVQAAQQLVEQRRAAAAATQANIIRLEATVPMENERAEAIRRLFEQTAASRMDYLQAEEQRIDRTQELAGQRKTLMLNRAALAEAEHNYRALMSEFQQTKQAELAAAETKVASLAQEVVKTGQRAKLQRLLSPIDGVVQQLAVHTVGGVVTPAQPILVVVPQDHPVEVEARVENKDVGFVREGQAVEIKVETFPFTLYGTIDGQVLSVSDDAMPVDNENEKAAVGLVYPSRISMERATIEVEGKRVNLSPGMAVTVEIKTGQRRIIQYLLSPLLKSLKESMRER